MMHYSRVIRKPIKLCQQVFRKHGASILTGMAVCFGAVAIGTAVKGTVEAVKLVDETEIYEEKRLTKPEIVKTTAKCYIPTALASAASVACLVGANMKHANDRAALTASATLAVNALNNYKGKAKELLGEKQEKRIVDAVAEDKVKVISVSDNEIVTTGYGTTLCIDSLFGRKFWSDADKIKNAIIDLNFRLNSEMFVTVNEYYAELGLPSVDMGERLGWDVSHGKIDPAFTSCLDDKGRPCFVVSHNNLPTYI